MLDVLVIAPHPDDAELGAGGAILQCKALGWRVGVVDLTDGEPTPHGDPQTRARETEAASQVLDLDWRENLRLTNRSLQASLESRGKLAETIRRLQPRWLMAPYWEDAHPDHTAATQLAEAARFWAKLSKTDLAGQPWHPERIFYYYCMHLRLAAQPAFVLDVTAHWDRKLAAIACYKSQFVTGRPSSLLEAFRAEAAHWGRLIGTDYGEPFASREPIGLNSLDRLT